jgi:hypothetical protein
MNQTSPNSLSKRDASHFFSLAATTKEIEIFFEEFFQY